MATTIDSWEEALKILGEDRKIFRHFFWRAISREQLKAAGKEHRNTDDPLPPELLAIALDRGNKFLDDAAAAEKQFPHTYDYRDGFITPNDYGSPGGRRTLATNLLLGLIARYRSDGTLSPELMPTLVNVLIWLAA